MHLDQITPMQTSYTQSSADIDGNTASNEEDEDNTSKSSDIEPSKDSDKTSISSKGSDVKDTDIR